MGAPGRKPCSQNTATRTALLPNGTHFEAIAALAWRAALPFTARRSRAAAVNVRDRVAARQRIHTVTGTCPSIRRRGARDLLLVPN